jgi:hypothetical protein
VERKETKSAYADPEKQLSVPILEALRPWGATIPNLTMNPLERVTRPTHHNPTSPAFAQHAVPPPLPRGVVRRVPRVCIDVFPILDICLGHVPADEVIIDVVKPFAVRRAALASRFDRLLAETAPEARLKVAAHAAVGKFLVEDGVVAEVVVPLEMRFEGLSAVADLAAFWLLRAVGHLLGASPDFELEVLAVLVPLPVVLAAELLVTFGKGAGVGFRMPFLVFPSARAFV